MFFASLIEKVILRYGVITSTLGNNLASSTLGGIIEIFNSNPTARVIISLCHLLWQEALLCHNLAEFIHSLVNRVPPFFTYRIGLNVILLLHRNKPYDHSLDSINVLVFSISFLLPFAFGLVFSASSMWYTMYVFSAAPRMSGQELRQPRNKIADTFQPFHTFFVILAIPRFFLALHLLSALFYLQDLHLWCWHKVHESRNLPEFPTPFLNVHQWHFFLVKLKNPTGIIEELNVMFQNQKKIMRCVWETRGQSQHIWENIPSRTEGSDMQLSLRRHVKTRGRSSWQVESRLIALSGLLFYHSDTQAPQRLQRRRRESRNSPLLQIPSYNNSFVRENLTENAATNASQEQSRPSVGLTRPVSYLDFSLTEQPEARSHEDLHDLSPHYREALENPEHIQAVLLFRNRQTRKYRDWGKQGKKVIPAHLETILKLREVLQVKWSSTQ